MSNDWIIDVLGDLRGFAVANSMPTLASQLEEAMVVTAAELAQVPDRGLARTHGSQVERLHGAAG